MNPGYGAMMQAPTRSETFGGAGTQGAQPLSDVITRAEDLLNRVLVLLDFVVDHNYPQRMLDAYTQRIAELERINIAANAMNRRAGRLQGGEAVRFTTVMGDIQIALDVKVQEADNFDGALKAWGYK